MNAQNLLYVLLSFLIGCFMSQAVSKLIIVRSLQKILETPKEKMTKRGMVIENGTQEGIKLLFLTKTIGNIGFNISTVTSFVIIVSFGITDSFNVMGMPICLNVIISAFVILIAMVHRPFFENLITDKDADKNSSKKLD